VILQSVMENASQDNLYQIIVFDCGMNASLLEDIKTQIERCANFTLRIISVTAWLEKYAYAFEEKWYLTKATYARLIIPHLCDDYDKVIYADIDMILNIDIAELMAIDLDDTYLAAVVDPIKEIERMVKPRQKKYINDILGLQSDMPYINAGLLVFNIKAWKAYDLTEKCITLLGKQKLQLLDQDAINCICRGKITYLEQKWNCRCIKNSIEDYASQINSCQTAYLHKLVEAWSQAYNAPKSVIHFTGTLKPWHSTEIEHASQWWHYCRKTNCYESMLSIAISKPVYNLLNSAGLNLPCQIIEYRLFNIAFIKIKIAPDCKRYEFLGMRFAKVVMKDKAKTFYFFGIKTMHVRRY